MSLQPGQSPYDNVAAEAHVRQLTAEFVAAKTAPPLPGLSEVAANLLRIADSKFTDETIRARAVKALEQYRGSPIVDELFTRLQRAEDARLLTGRIERLKRGGFLK